MAVMRLVLRAFATMCTGEPAVAPDAGVHTPAPSAEGDVQGSPGAGGVPTVIAIADLKTAPPASQACTFNACAPEGRSRSRVAVATSKSFSVTTPSTNR